MNVMTFGGSPGYNYHFKDTDGNDIDPEVLYEYSYARDLMGLATHVLYRRLSPQEIEYYHLKWANHKSDQKFWTKAYAEWFETDALNEWYDHV